MAERKPCIRCERPIDANARSCVYCNWDQGAPKPVATAAAAQAAPAYVPPRDTRLRNRILGAIAFVALVIIAFVVGSLVHGSDPNEAKASQTPALHPTSTAQAEAGPRADVTLVPVTGDGSMQTEPPITSAPAQPPSAGNVDVNGDRTDATALPSDAYSAAAQRARAERDVRTSNGMIDPRTIPGGVERPVQRAPMPAAAFSTGSRRFRAAYGADPALSAGAAAARRSSHQRAAVSHGRNRRPRARHRHRAIDPRRDAAPDRLGAELALQAGHAKRSTRDIDVLGRYKRPSAMTADPQNISATASPARRAATTSTPRRNSVRTAAPIRARARSRSTRRRC